jgi:hypothetical protein
MPGGLSEATTRFIQIPSDGATRPEHLQEGPALGSASPPHLEELRRQQRVVHVGLRERQRRGELHHALLQLPRHRRLAQSALRSMYIDRMSN